MGTLSVKTVSVSLRPTRQGGRKGVSTRPQRQKPGREWALGPWRLSAQWEPSRV